jgi:hypothetical protein
MWAASASSSRRSQTARRSHSIVTGFGEMSSAPPLRPRSRGRQLRDRHGRPWRSNEVGPGETGETKLDGARLPREASPTKVAKDGQHNDDDDDDPEPGRHVILSLGACRLYDEPTRTRNVYGATRRWERLAPRRARTRAARGYGRCTLALEVKPESVPGSRARRRVSVGRASFLASRLGLGGA